MKTRRIWVLAVILLALMTWMGINTARQFDVVATANRTITELEWTVLYDDTSGYRDIWAIDGGNHFIALEEGISYVIIDELGEKRSDSYNELTELGGGYLEFQTTRTGVVLDETGENLKTRGVMDDAGRILSEEEAAAVLAAATREESGGAKDTAAEAQTDGSRLEDGQSADAKGAAEGTAGYFVKKSADGKFCGLQDSTGNWVIPPVFDRVELNSKQTNAVIRYGSVMGVVRLH